MDIIAYNKSQPTPELASFIPVIVEDTATLHRLYRKYKKPQHRLRTVKQADGRTMVILCTGRGYPLEFRILYRGGLGVPATCPALRSYFPYADYTKWPDYLSYKQIVSLAADNFRMTNYLKYEFTESDVILKAISTASKGSTITLEGVNYKNNRTLYKHMKQTMGDRIELTNESGTLTIYKW